VRGPVLAQREPSEIFNVKDFLALFRKKPMPSDPN
jgi:hypothetical protein